MYEVKMYKVNMSWGIICTLTDKELKLDVVMLQVPWQEIVEKYSYSLIDKDKANDKFKQLIKKYREIGEIYD